MNERDIFDAMGMADDAFLFETLDDMPEHRPAVRRRIVLAAVCACIMLVIGANAWSLHATGVGLLSRTYRFSSKSFSFDLSDTDKYASLDIGEQGDPYGIRAECEKHGFSPLVPQYRPEGYALIETAYKPTNIRQYVFFTFKNRKKIISMSYYYYPDSDNIQTKGWGFPSDTHNVSELVINGVTVTVSQEDLQYRAMFLLNNTIYSFGTKEIDYAEAEQILRSMFE